MLSAPVGSGDVGVEAASAVLPLPDRLSAGGDVVHRDPTAGLLGAVVVDGDRHGVDGGAVVSVAVKADVQRAGVDELGAAARGLPSPQSMV